MEGDDTFLFTITEVPKLFNEYFEQCKYSMEDFDYCVLHQANLMILNQIAKKLKLPQEKMPVSIDKYGNTDGASIPLGVADLCQRLDGDRTLRLVVSGFGIGLSWGIAGFDIRVQDVLPVIFTDEYFEEGFDV
jgi:3-oxoacyl-[acyl-carrier-protein] synthase-3